MKRYTKILTLILGVGIGIGVSGFLGNDGNTKIAYGNNGVAYERLSGYEESYDESYEEYYKEECYTTGNSTGCRRGYSDNFRNQNSRNRNSRNEKSGKELLENENYRDSSINEERNL